MNNILLEEAYALVRAKQFLLSEGYSNQEIDILIEKGEIWNTIKRAGKNIRRAGAIGAAAAVGLGGMHPAQGNEIDDIINQTKGGVLSAIGSVSSNFKKSQEDINKQVQVDNAKMDELEKQFQKEIVPLLTPGYERSANFIFMLISDITANGRANGRKDYDKQLESLARIKEVLQKTSGINQKIEVEKMLKSVYFK